MQYRLGIGVGVLCVVVGLLAMRLAPLQRTVLFPAAGWDVLAVDDHSMGGSSWSHIQLGLARVGFTYGLGRGAVYPFAGIKIFQPKPQGAGLDLSSVDFLEIGMRADSGVALRVSLKSPAPELQRPADPSAMFYHEAEFEPFGIDTLRMIRMDELRMPSWWRIREKWPRDQELQRLDAVQEIEILNGFAQVARDSVRVELRSIVALSRSVAVLRFAWALVGLGVLCLLWGIWRGRRKKRPPVHAPLEGGRSVEIPDASLAVRARVLDHLKEHYADPEYSLGALARGAGLTERAASEALKAATGTHFKGALNELRLKEAARLLQQKHNVSEVAFAVGFNHHSHFTRAFKARFGVAPSEYRG